MNLELVQRNNRIYVFIFSVVNYIKGEKKKTYILIRKDVGEMKRLLNDECLSSSDVSLYKQALSKESNLKLIRNFDKV